MMYSNAFFHVFAAISLTWSRPLFEMWILACHGSLRTKIVAMCFESGFRLAKLVYNGHVTRNNSITFNK